MPQISLKNALSAINALGPNNYGSDGDGTRHTAPVFDSQSTRITGNTLAAGIDEEHLAQIFDGAEMDSGKLSLSTVARYLPYHSFGEDYGVEIYSNQFSSYVRALFRKLVAAGICHPGPEGQKMAWDIAYAAIVEHERFHHRVENAVTYHEIFYGINCYRSVGPTTILVNPFKVGPAFCIDKALLLEEALASSRMLIGSNWNRVSPNLSVRDRKSICESIVQLSEGLEGYQDGVHLMSNRKFQSGFQNLLATFLDPALSAIPSDERSGMISIPNLIIGGFEGRIEFVDNGGPLGAIMRGYSILKPKSDAYLTFDDVLLEIQLTMASRYPEVNDFSDIELTQEFLEGVNRREFIQVRPKLWRKCCEIISRRYEIGRILNSHHVKTASKTGVTSYRVHVENESRINQNVPVVYVEVGGGLPLTFTAFEKHDDYKH
jgi:hypothetical protein